MDFTKITCISEECKNKSVIMGGAGGHFGHLDVVKVKCPSCGLLLAIVPIKEGFEYTFSGELAKEK